MPGGVGLQKTVDLHPVGVGSLHMLRQNELNLKSRSVQRIDPGAQTAIELNRHSVVHRPLRRFKRKGLCGVDAQFKGQRHDPRLTWNGQGAIRQKDLPLDRRCDGQQRSEKEGSYSHSMVAGGLLLMS